MIKLGSTGGLGHFWQPGKVNVYHAQPSVEPTRHAQPASVHRRLANVQSQSTALQLGAQGHWCYRGCPSAILRARPPSSARRRARGFTAGASWRTARGRAAAMLCTRNSDRTRIRRTSMVPHTVAHAPPAAAFQAQSSCCVNCELQRNGQRTHCHEGSPPPGDSKLSVALRVARPATKYIRRRLY